MENYVHRVGRTARAGRPGLVVNLVTERDEALIKRVNLELERR
jgi:superfamily II DNA/RNA helicase